ncbi:uncharacterized protein CTRU02_209058 [Colletotrichum truncatum]|uniref:Uncharacterized protein n=1 Tax=Colletotrichum truncatum TaxID=5467 RepID=A0ACC3YZR0_COLTU|nr:uncharacterized protein CTRU02_07751 [Colletotrichum truncatum]KAF6790845.1 hypothetical protein CTRU02_07751 [Colletotrichum truncatum]
MPSLGARDLVARASINHVPQPQAGKVVSIIVALVSACTLASLFALRITTVKDWRILPWTMWLVTFIYLFSFIFVFGTSILQFGFGTDLNYETCSAATLFCLGAYVATKFIYLFMVDRAHIIRQTSKPRLKSKLYLVNSFGMLGVFVIIVIMNFIFRITDFVDGICVIGLGRGVVLPLISFDAAVNVYLTILFLLPLLSLHSVKYNFWKPWTLDWRNQRIPRAPPNVRLRKLVVRTFIGSCCTLLSSVTNLTVLTALNGEVAWLCLLCCNTDIFFSALVMNWVTSPGQESTLRTLTRPSRGVSTLRPDDDQTYPLDPDGNSTGKAWDPRRTPTSTTIGLQSTGSRGDNVEDGVELHEQQPKGHDDPEALNHEIQSKHNSLDNHHEADDREKPELNSECSVIRKEEGSGNSQITTI